ncbi:VOC family protein [Paraburkholderia sp.]|uniref:VOC family protein n=1 Tax=Paraburkholderia sp. TaxID=1926495 RepID=UPI003D6E7B15
MYVQPYLFFDGRCEEALTFYGERLGAQVLQKMHFRDAPPNPDQPIRPGTEDKVMHASFQIGSTTLMASDGDCNATPKPISSFALSLTADDAASAKRYYDALAQDGQVMIPWQETFWSKGFGMLQDRLGVAWMISAPEEK